ncbi:hypothetical protein [Nonlabens sp. Asnod3-A02]|uniref:hypothetical protein n=1 Tax=Nonlabens sp. Asnod3-A02 TaxID=3160579 RepID=UPI0038632EF0
MDAYLILIIAILFAIAIATYIGVEKIKKKRSSGSKSYQKKLYYQVYFKHFVSNIPD